MADHPLSIHNFPKDVLIDMQQALQRCCKHNDKTFHFWYFTNCS